MPMTKEHILEYYKDIGAYYNDDNRYSDLSKMLDKLIESVRNGEVKEEVTEQKAFKSALESLNALKDVSPNTSVYVIGKTGERLICKFGDSLISEFEGMLTIDEL